MGHTTFRFVLAPTAEQARILARASFVVERDSTPLPPVARTAGIDLGLAWLAAVAGSDGTVEQVANPRHLRAAQRQLARKRKGSANRAKARHRVAVAHRKVHDRRPITTTSWPFG